MSKLNKRAGQRLIERMREENYPILSREEEIELFKKAKAGDKEAKDKILKYNMRLVIAYAKEYCSSLPYDRFEDCVSAGNIGLIEAYDKFDINRGTKFSTYATQWIIMEIKKELNKDLVNISPFIKSNMAKIRKAKEELQKKGIPNPSSKDIANYLNINEKIVKRYSKIKIFNKATYNTLSGITEEEVLTFKFHPTVSGESIEVSYIKEAIENADLTDMEREAVLNISGILGKPRLSIDRFAKKENIKYTKAKSLYSSGLQKIKEYLIAEHPELSDNKKGG